MRLIFELADRWGEPDPRKIAALPANVLRHWQAFFMLNAQENDLGTEPVSVNCEVSDDITVQCNDVMRVLNG
ncbi:hypothetical protein [Photorhabdus temperata]|uniref:Uncharacterized protein n=1 Tax=Photorhabdus temperata J3 TaxID=1389415 RepID=U7QWR9_PHOTE|nr:hypothetical protein [Photorhabdus temperata]ERT11405.1 hypothetical protein O185_19650 [Photorhabdus temperata J3]